MSDPRHKHQFIPSRKGTCKMYVGGAICKLGEDALVHKRYEEDMSENNTEESREQIAEELARLVLTFDDSPLLIYELADIKKMLDLARQWLELHKLNASKEEGR